MSASAPASSAASCAVRVHPCQLLSGYGEWGEVGWGAGGRAGRWAGGWGVGLTDLHGPEVCADRVGVVAKLQGHDLLHGWRDERERTVDVCTVERVEKALKRCERR